MKVTFSMVVVLLVLLATGEVANAKRIPAELISISGRVVAIADGDTLTLLSDRTQIKVRLAEIDAPEKAQAFGQKSKKSLSDLCFGKEARVETKGNKSYERIIGRVWCDGVDVSAEQVRRGMAWVYDRYVNDRSLYAVQDLARSLKSGLWIDSNPVKPWEFRHHVVQY